MPAKPLRVYLAALPAATAIVGCAVLPTSVYVPDAVEGAPVYERCSLTPDLPVGVKLERSGLHAIVSVAHSQGVDQVQVRFDVAEGMTLVLLEHAIAVDARDGGATRSAAIPHINPVAPARYPDTPAIEKLVLPIDAPLRGGRVGTGSLASGRHYWIAAPVEGELAGDVWVSLPEVSVDDTAARFPAIRFARRLTVGRGFLNC